METRRLTDIEQIRQIYDTRMRYDFAPDELRPWFSLREGWERDEYDCYGLFDGDELLGYAFFVHLLHGGKVLCLLDYLAITETRRGEGLGSLFLRQLSGYLRDFDCIVGEMEDPEAAGDPEERAARERRMRFYLRSGYRATALRSLVFGVDYLVFEVPAGKDHTTEELREAYTVLYRSILSPFFFQACFKIKES